MSTYSSELQITKAVDSLISRRSLQEVEGKHFPHKRAFELAGVLVELFLTTRDQAGWHTNFWDVMRFRWPLDSFDDVDVGVPTVSRSALAAFRLGHSERARARVGWMEQNGRAAANERKERA